MKGDWKDEAMRWEGLDKTAQKAAEKAMTDRKHSPTLYHPILYRPGGPKGDVWMDGGWNLSHLAVQAGYHEDFRGPAFDDALASALNAYTAQAARVAELEGVLRDCLAILEPMDTEREEDDEPMAVIATARALLGKP